jgi:hypothetical protein
MADVNDVKEVTVSILETVLNKLDDKEAAKSFAEKTEAVSAENVEATGKSGC